MWPYPETFQVVTAWGGATGKWMEARDAAENPAVHRVASATNEPAQMLSKATGQLYGATG